MLPSSEVELTFTILAVDTSEADHDPNEGPYLADIIKAQFPTGSLFSDSPILDVFQAATAQMWFWDG